MGKDWFERFEMIETIIFWKKKYIVEHGMKKNNMIQEII